MRIYNKCFSFSIDNCKLEKNKNKQLLKQNKLNKRMVSYGHSNLIPLSAIYHDITLTYMIIAWWLRL